MKLLYETYQNTIKDEDMSETTETVLIYGFDDEVEAEDFELLSHNEQISELGLESEKATPNKDKGLVTRYYIDISDSFVIVRKNKILW